MVSHVVRNGLIIGSDGIQRWYRNGELHREDGPAVIHADGAQEWYLYLENTRISMLDGSLKIGGSRPVELADPSSKASIISILKRGKITPVSWLAELVK